MRTFDDAVFLINPNVDASDKEMFSRNGFKSAGKNMVAFIKNGDRGVFAKDLFRPSKFG
jgi:hypothetical protein